MELANDCEIKIKFHSSEAADMVKRCLEVDEELQPTKMNRQLRVEDNFLIIKISAETVKLLRVGVSSILDMALVCGKTLMEFDSSMTV